MKKEIGEFEDFKDGCKNAIPICLGYMAVSFAFGIEAAKIGMTTFQAAATSLLNVTSAGQFSALEVIARNGSFIELAVLDYYFTFLMFAVVIFLIISLMENMKMNIAYALGLFAIFGMIRYRTETIKIREMTYLFVVMGLSIVNGMALSTSYSELIMVNLLTVLVVWILDGTKLLKPTTATKIVLYDRIENTKHGKEEELKADLAERTGLEIQKVEVGHIDYLRDVAFVKVYYTPVDGEVNTIDTITKLKDFNE